jgi:hypothetical protein
MKLSGRLRSAVSTHGGVKYQTNIRYLLPRDVQIREFRTFVKEYLSGSYQYRRLTSYFENLSLDKYIPVPGRGFGDIWTFLAMQLGDRRAISQSIRRMGRLLMNPFNIYFLVKAAFFVLARRTIKGRFGYFQFWIFAWTNAMTKYSSIKDREFDIESVPPDFEISKILPDEYSKTANEKIPRHKIEAQLKHTSDQLRRIIAKHEVGKPPVTKHSV